MSNEPRVIIHRRDRILDDFLKVDAAQLQFQHSDGSMSPVIRQLSLERGDAVGALLFDEARQLAIFARQFRFPTLQKGPGWLVEIAAGMIEDNETPEEAVIREVREELGQDPQLLCPIGCFYLSPGGSSERVFLYVACIDATSRIGAGGGLVEEFEDIQQIELSLSEIWRMIDAGEIQDAKTVIACMWLRQTLAAGQLEDF